MTKGILVCNYTVFTNLGLSRWFSGEESACQRRRRGFDSWVWKIPWRWEWLPTSVFLPGEFHEERILTGYSPWGCKGVGHNWATKHQPQYLWIWCTGKGILSFLCRDLPNHPVHTSSVSIVPCLLQAVLLYTWPLLLQSHSNDACGWGCWNIFSLVDITNNNHQTMELCWCKISPHSTRGKSQLTESCRATRWWWRFSGILQLKTACSGHGAISPLFLLCQPPATMPAFHSSQIKWNKNHQGLKSLHSITVTPFRT